LLSGITNSAGKLDNVDLRVGFMETPSDFVTTNYNSYNYDPNSVFGTNGVELHLNVSNAGPDWLGSE
jgi:hypothetical protein